MDNNENKTRFKLRCVLLELLKSDYQVTDDTILEKLISLLSVKDEGYKIIDVPLCTAWARSVVSSWHDGKSSAVVVSFALRLLAIIVENENNFRDMQKSDGLVEPGSECIVNTNHGGVFLLLLREVCLTTTKSVSDFSVKCALIKLLSSLLKHSCGRQWIMSSGLWKEVHEMCLSDSSVYVVREARKFLSDLLNGMSQSQDLELESVLVNILEPFLSIPTFSDPALSTPRVIASLHLVSEVLDNALLTSDPQTNIISSPVFNIISKPSFALLSRSLEALKVTKSEEMEELLSKIAAAFYILTTVKDGKKHEPHEIKAVCIQILGVFNVLINKGSVENVLKLCVLCHNYWTYVAKIQRANEEECPPAKGDEKHYRFEDQLLCLQLAPIFSLIVTAPSENDKELYLYKLSYKICFESQRLVFSFRNMVLTLQRLHHWLAMSARSVMCLAKRLTRILPMCVGIAQLGSEEYDFIADMTEAFINKLTSVIHHAVHRSAYLFRAAITERGFDERLALLGVSSILSLKNTLTRLTPLCVGCTIGDSTPESYFQIQVSQRLALDVMRSIYAYRDALIKTQNSALMDRSALQSVVTLSSLSIRGVHPEVDRDRAVLVFQSFIYVLKHFVLCAESEDKQVGWGGEFRQSHHSTLLVAILDGLANLVRSHRITWRESVESLCLLTLAQELLNSPTFSSKVGLVVQALQLIKLCIENFMPPNLALLTNSLSGTSLDHLGPLIYKRLHDPHWEVRDSSLEVLLTLATISHTKYPLFQELILDNKLTEVVVHLALNDAENYVCASATKCLTAMVCVDRFWNEELTDKDLVNKMIGILNGESEGVLRREASLLMSEIFKYRKVPSDVLHKMCVTMANVVLADLHWEVKVNALTFWKLMIERQMNDQGMIDGVFPQVTFSKEHRKIINLTPAVIQDRLRRVLTELSLNGCLHVLLEAICKDEDLEVVKRASEIISFLSVVLERHGLLDLKNNLSSTPTSSEASSALGSNAVLSPSNQSDSLSESTSSVMSSYYEVEMPVHVQVENSELNTNHHNTLNSSDNSRSPGKSILDLDPQVMGFDVLNDDVLDLPSISQADLQDKVIDSILNDRDINLLAKVYLGTGAEVTGRQGPETKISKPVRPLVVLSPEEFLCQLSILQVDKIVSERSRWVKDTGGNLDTLLDDMLITRNLKLEEDDFNAMDCY
ncbi:BRCA1-associated ATM activator 1 [Frankliniella fusca]|uniref:BRCA1-associated ATM activator 1 n=1 Tax=Frankliniella fusca TaxID=407009 RepID=A0AAE1LT71_9NEOP|nr:BRCA1-associated ATM activator 1 [Frankliniella fusca]